MYSIECVPAAEGISQPPCYAVAGVEYVPVMSETIHSGPGAVDFAGSASLYWWALGLIISLFFLGVLTGGLMRVIRAA